MLWRIFALTVTLCVGALAQGSQAILAQIEKEGCAAHTATKVNICRADYSVDGAAVEAISFRPAGDGKFPAALLIPGFMRTAKDQMVLGVTLAGAGIGALAVTQPGFGGSAGPADYVGPKTIKVL